MKKKSKKILKTVKILEIVTLLLALSSFASVKTTAPETKSQVRETYYTLSVYDGRIAVFENGSDKPVEVFDTFVSSLPYTEQNELQDGITARDKSELMRLIEDYTS